jgi:hypothetical protein
MSKEKIKDILIRAGKTFTQAFLSALSVDALLGVTDVDTFKRIGISILIAAGAAGISAVWNMILDFINKKIDEIMPTEDGLTKALEGGDVYVED